MFQVLLFVAADKEFWQVGHVVEIEMPERGGVFGGVVLGRAWEGAFTPDEGCDVVREQVRVAMCDHAANVVADDVNGSGDLKVSG